jgi:hypothetical protein
MKKFMIMCMMLLATTLTFTACGDDDDDVNPQEEVNQENYYKYSESTNVPNFGNYTVIGEATFANGKATAIAISFVYPKKSYASDDWADYQEDEDLNISEYSYDGDRTITWRMGQQSLAYYSTLSKEEVCKLIKHIVSESIADVNEAIGK